MTKELQRWNELARSYWHNRSDEQRWLHNYLLYPAIMNEIIASNASIVLDYGCSDGCFSIFVKDNVPSCQIYAYDKAVEMRKLAMNNLKQDGLVLDSLGNRKFECIILNMVLQAVEDYDALIQTINKHLSKNGVVIVSIPNFDMAMEHGKYSTAKHKNIEVDEKSGESIEKMYWVDSKNGWTYKYNRKNDHYLKSFIDNGFVLSHMYSPKPVDSGKSNLGMYEYNLQKDETILMVYRRKELC